MKFKRLHIEGKLYNSKLCQTEFLTECDLRTHIEPAHSVRRHICDKCQNKFPFKNYLKKHSHTAHTVIRPICDECQNNFLHKSYLKKHCDWTDTVTRLICDECRNKFLHKKDLKKHSDTTHICDECQNKFPHKNYLKKHIVATHPGSRILVTFVDNVLSRNIAPLHTRQVTERRWKGQAGIVFKNKTNISVCINRVYSSLFPVWNLWKRI